MSGGGGSRNRFPFTDLQWRELEQQALMYKYIVTGLPIPPHLLFTLNKTSSSSSSHEGWRCYERKVDPEPWRCRRTDGKKWRCSKEAYNESKYCVKHMHRGKNRSRKPVEFIPSLTTASTTTTTSTPPLLSLNPSSTHLHLSSASFCGGGGGGASSSFTNNTGIFRSRTGFNEMKDGVGRHEHVFFSTEPSKTSSGSPASSSSKPRNVLMSMNNECRSYLQLQSSCNEQNSYAMLGGDIKLSQTAKGGDRGGVEGGNEEHGSTVVYRFF